MSKSVTSLLTLVLAATSSFAAYGNGICIVDASESLFFEASETHVVVSVENQIAIVKATLLCRNLLGEKRVAKYGFPMPEGASATSLRWRVNGQWREAVFASVPQDTTLPGSGAPDTRLTQYLGATPLFFPISDTVGVDSLLTIELTYAQLLPYKFGSVDFIFPSSYEPLAPPPLGRQTLSFELSSSRTIEHIDLVSHPAAAVTNDGTLATVQYQVDEENALTDYHVTYRLSLNELGLFGFSTSIADSAAIDSLGTGFFTFVAEPDPTEGVEVIDKVFTLIVDRSGSMTGDKIVQARNAATFIVDRLNDGDQFNIVDFNSAVRSFRPSLVPYTPANRNAAVDYIATFQASGLTNISGAFSLAVPQFNAVSDSTANIIVFFTDGRPTTGLTETSAILQHISDLITQNERNITLFAFGVGRDVNHQLLTLMANQNNGLVAFLEDDELEERITEFYLQIQNPVLLNTEIVVDPPVITEVFPNPLPNLYKGQQMVVAGRYDLPADVTVTLSGEAYGRDVTYSYDLSLSDSLQEGLLFLPKIWAKLKIEHLLVRYYGLAPGSDDAETLQQEIIDLSVAYGVISPFTSFGENDPGGLGFGGTGGAVNVEDEVSTIPGESPVLLHGTYPNPFRESTTIRFEVSAALFDDAVVKIYDSLGRLGAGAYRARWRGWDLRVRVGRTHGRRRSHRCRYLHIHVDRR